MVGLYLHYCISYVYEEPGPGNRNLWVGLGETEVVPHINFKLIHFPVHCSLLANLLMV